MKQLSERELIWTFLKCCKKSGAFALVRTKCSEKSEEEAFQRLQQCLVESGLSPEKADGVVWMAREFGCSAVEFARDVGLELADTTGKLATGMPKQSAWGRLERLRRFQGVLVVLSGGCAAAAVASLVGAWFAGLDWASAVMLSGGMVVLAGLCAFGVRKLEIDIEIAERAAYEEY